MFQKIDPAKNQAKQEELRQWLLSLGYIEYQPGAFAKTDPGKKVEDGFRRYKFQDNVLHLQTAYRNSQGGLEWMRMRSGYYSKLSINDGKLSGLTR